MAGLRLFTYNPFNGEFYIDIESIRLTKAFNELWLKVKEQCKCNDVDADANVGNPEAVQKFTDYCKFIYLSNSWSSPYFDYDDNSRVISSLQDAELEPNEVDFPELKNAVDKFLEIQSMDRNYRLLVAARKQVDNLINYFLDEDKLNKTVDGKPMYKPKEITDELKKVDDLSDYLDKTEERIKQGEVSKNRIKGDAVEGFVVDFVKERERREKEIEAKRKKEKEKRIAEKAKEREVKEIVNPKTNKK